MNIAIHIPTYTRDHDTFPIPLQHDYGYWVSLVENFLAKSNAIEIHCWHEENEIIEEIASLFPQAFQMSKEENLTIFKGNTTSLLAEYLLHYFKSANGNFKWFTVNLINDNETRFHSGHWGTEFFIPNVLEEEVRWIKGIVPDDTSLLQF